MTAPFTAARVREIADHYFSFTDDVKTCEEAITTALAEFAESVARELEANDTEMRWPAHVAQDIRAAAKRVTG